MLCWTNAALNSNITSVSYKLCCPNPVASLPSPIALGKLVDFVARIETEGGGSVAARQGR